MLFKNIPISWIKPDVSSEMGELERVAKTFFPSKIQPEILAQLTQSINVAEPEELSDKMWSALENTDSWHNVRPGFIEDGEKIGAKYHKDFASILTGYRDGAQIQMPIILRLPDGRLHLISGNTRLAAARVLEVRPMVLVVSVHSGSPIQSIHLQ